MFHHARSGLYLTHYRAYDPHLGRWLSRDPLGLAGGMNLYAYVEGNPISYTDPTGLETYICQVPLEQLGGGAGRKTGPDRDFNPLYHEYICIVRGGKVVCGGQTRDHNRRAPWIPGWIPKDQTEWIPYGPGAKSHDKYLPENCDKQRDDDDCYENCLRKEFNGPRPSYGFVGPGTNCQEWVGETTAKCISKCPVH